MGIDSIGGEVKEDDEKEFGKRVITMSEFD